jgi:hypothetical protein
MVHVFNIAVLTTAVVYVYCRFITR